MPYRYKLRPRGIRRLLDIRGKDILPCLLIGLVLALLLLAVDVCGGECRDIGVHVIVKDSTETAILRVAGEGLNSFVIDSVSDAYEIDCRLYVWRHGEVVFRSPAAGMAVFVEKGVRQ